MGIRPDTKYNGVVREGSALCETQTGTVGYQVLLDCEDGATEYMIWLTEKNKEKARKTFINALGVDPENLKSKTYFDYQLGQDIAGLEVSFGTREEEYKGRKKVKVAWIGKKSSASAGGVAGAAAQFFGGAAVITDDDIPF